MRAQSIEPASTSGCANKKRQILRDEAYDAIAALLRPYQDAILAATAGPEGPASSSEGDDGGEGCDEGGGDATPLNV